MREPSPASAPAAWGAASRSCSPMRGTRSRWSTSRRATMRRSTSCPTTRSAKSATCSARSRASACSIRPRSTPSGARVGRAGERRRRPRSRPPPIIFEGVPEVLDLKREALARASQLAGPEADHRLDHVDHPGRRSVRRGRTPRALPQRALAQSGLPGAAGRGLARQAHRSRRHGAREGAAGKRRQGAGRVRGAAGLHRAAHPGARDERGRAHGRGRRRQRRGHRQGDQVRLRHPLRGARHARVHRLGRRRHSLLRQPLSDRRARQRALRRAGDRRAQHGRGPHAACATARAFSTTKGSTWKRIGASG